MGQPAPTEVRRTVARALAGLTAELAYVAVLAGLGLLIAAAAVLLR